MKRALILLFIYCLSVFAQGPDSVKPYGSLPTAQHIKWHQMEFYAFIHFNMNTFTGREWGEGIEDPAQFNPTALNCRQWASVIKGAGMKGIIITAKHHDGFCLWPSKYSSHTVRESGWKNGKGDILKELSDACKEYGLKFGIYLSPWDRNHPAYGTDEYNNVFVNTLKEVLSGYGETFEVWFDGANGEGPNGKKQVYNWPLFYKTVKELQPNALIFGPVGSDIRWVGNEDGYANETNWGTMNKEMTEASAGLSLLNTGFEGGNIWRPSEVDVSIRPGWYYRSSEDSKVKSLNKLVDIYFSSVGRGSNLLLNIPPDKRGLINENDVRALTELNNYLTESFKTNLAADATVVSSNPVNVSLYFSPGNITDDNYNSYWSADGNSASPSFEIRFKSPLVFNCLELQEYISLGQRVKSFLVEALTETGWKEISRGTTIGYKRLLRFPQIKAESVRVIFTKFNAPPVICNAAVFKTIELVSTPVIKRSKNGIVKITGGSPQSVIHYTVDGTEPGKKSPLYASPFEMKNKGVVRALAFSGDYLKSSPVASEVFGTSKEKWRIIYTDDEHPALKAENAIDDDPSTFWHTHWSGNYKKHPHEIVIDFGEQTDLSGITFLPRQDGNNSGNITSYRLYLSLDNVNWISVVNDGRFDNIANNPALQTVAFKKKETARYLKLVTLGDSNNNGWVNVAEIGIL